MATDIGEAQVSYRASQNPPQGIYWHRYENVDGKSAVSMLTPLATKRVDFVLGDGRGVVAQIVNGRLELRSPDGRLIVFPDTTNVVAIGVADL